MPDAADFAAPGIVLSESGSTRYAPAVAASSFDSAVVGSIVVATSSTRSAGNPPSHGRQRGEGARDTARTRRAGAGRIRLALPFRIRLHRPRRLRPGNGLAGACGGRTHRPSIQHQGVVPVNAPTRASPISRVTPADETGVTLFRRRLGDEPQRRAVLGINDSDERVGDLAMDG